MLSVLVGSPDESRKKEVLVWSSWDQEVRLKAGETTRISNVVVDIDPNIPLTGFLGTVCTVCMG